MCGGPHVNAGFRASVMWWPETHSFTVYGPSLTGARPNPASAARTLIGESRESVRLLSSGANGSPRVSRSVRESTASTDFTGPSCALATGDFVSGATAHSIDALTVCAVTGVPSWKLAPALSLNVHT